MVITSHRDPEWGQIQTSIELTEGANFDTSKAEIVAAILSFSKLMAEEAALVDIPLTQNDILYLIKEEINFRTDSVNPNCYN